MKQILYFFALIIISHSSWGQTENYWIKKADFAGLKRERAVSFVINGKGYVGTGVDTAETVRKDFWAYDPLTNSWTQVADFTGVGRRNAIAFSIDNVGYVGTGMSNDQSSLGTTLSDIWSYNAQTNTWTQKSNFPGNFGQGIYFSTAFAVNGKGYICGGKMGPSNYTDELWEYNPITDSWTQKTAFPGGVRYQLASFVVNDKAYVGFGIDLDVFRKDLWEYNPITDTWTQKNDFLGSERGAVSTFSFNGSGFICLGSDGGFKKDVWEYNPYDDSWSIRANYGGSARKNAIAFVIGDTAYVGTGKGVSGKKMSFYAYVPYQSALNINQINNADVSVYPNPVINQLNINVNSKQIKNILIYNLTGQQIYQTTVNSSKLVVNRNEFDTGVYLIVAKDESGQILFNKKIIFK